MFRKVALTVCMMVGCVWCMALESGAESAVQSVGPGPFKPVASVGSLMHGQGGAMKQIMQHLAKPANKKRNHEIEEGAELLAELANVNRYNHTDDDYVTYATELRDIAMDLAKEAKKQDADNNKMNGYVQQLKGKCGACHDAYQ